MRDNFHLCGRFCQVFSCASLDTPGVEESALWQALGALTSPIARVDLAWAPYRKNTPGSLPRGDGNHMEQGRL